MSKRTLTLITSVTGGIATIASAVVGYMKPEYLGAIVASIDIVATAVIAVCTQFVQPDILEKKK